MPAEVQGDDTCARETAWAFEAEPPAFEPESRAADLLLPFADLSGDVLIAGAPALAAAVAKAACSVTVATTPDGQADRAYDAIVLVDPFDGPAWGSLALRLRPWTARLRPGGRLILAADNALALRHFSGAGGGAGGTDPFASGGLPTRSGLRQALAETGLAHQAWWFPFPDHRTVLSLVSEAGIAGPGGFDAAALAVGAAPFDERAAAHPVFSMRLALRRLTEAGLLADLAPAFVVSASAAPLPPETRLALHLGHARRPEFDRIATFMPEGGTVRVRRAPRWPGLPDRLGAIRNRFPDEILLPGRPWHEALEDRLARDGWDLPDLTAWALIWFGALRRAFPGAAANGAPSALPAHAFDAIPRNLLVGESGAGFIDLEWMVEAPFDLGHLLVRGCIDTFLAIRVCGAPAPDLDPTFLNLLRAVLVDLGLDLDDDALSERLEREARFQQVVSGRWTDRDLHWLRTTRMTQCRPLPAHAAVLAREAEDLRARNRRLHGAEVQLRADLAESRLCTDRIVVYAADLDRDGERLRADCETLRTECETLRAALDAARAAAAAPARTVGPAGRLIRRLSRGWS